MRGGKLKKNLSDADVKNIKHYFTKISDMNITDSQKDMSGWLSVFLHGNDVLKARAERILIRAFDVKVWNK